MTAIHDKQCGSSTCSHEVHESISIHKHKETSSDKAFRLIERVSAIGLGVIAALTEFWLFVPSFIVGGLIGVFSYKEPDHVHSHKDGSCSIGFFEQITGVKLPRSLGLAAGIAVTAAHIDHHASVFVPIVGVTLGIWAGKALASSLNLSYKKIVVQSSVHA